LIGLVIALIAIAGLMLASNYNYERFQATLGCIELGIRGFRPVGETGKDRFLGKVKDFTAVCRGGHRAVAYRDTPWNDWANYWGTGDESSRFQTHVEWLSKHLGPNDRGIDGALIDLEYQRLELITLNLHDPNTYEDYVKGRDGVDGGAIRVWKEMRIEPGQPYYKDVGGDGKQACTGELIRHRTLTGICNDVFNPRMGSSGMRFARNAQFEETFPDLGRSKLHQARHGDRVGLLKPDPQVVSRKLLSRAQQFPERCNEGRGLPGNPADAHCDYEAAPWFNVLAAFWIQFMTHDWFSHLDEGANAPEYMSMGCDADSKKLGCRPGDRAQKGLYADRGDPGTFEYRKRVYERRPYSTSRNNVTAWWDASQIYGYDERSRKRVKRDPSDRAKLLLRPLGDRPGEGEKQGYLPLLASCEGASAASGCQPDPMNPLWRGQEATAFPDNWTLGMSFYHNVFAREHNAFVTEFRRRAAREPNTDSGLRNPADPARVITYRQVTDDELFEAGRLLVAAEIAKIHTIEWTTQLLYNEPLFRGMNANWGGFFDGKKDVEAALQAALRAFARSGDARQSSQLYSVFAAGPGIIGLQSTRPEGGFIARLFGTQRDTWSLANLEHVNGGVNHFGSPFNFPEEFTTVYRLHPLVPDLIEYREWSGNPNAITAKLPVGSMFRRAASETMHSRGLANIALSMGRQRLGVLALGNHPVFLQNLSMPQLDSATQAMDIPALDLVRDREHGIPRFNEFRRQYGLQSLRSFDDFVDKRASNDKQEKQRAYVAKLREVYGQHTCDDSKIITDTQLLNGKPMTDCLGFQHGTTVDNIEDVDTVVGWLSEFTRPHGFAISETQFVVFILNASRRLFSDRFFTSSLRPEFYTSLGIDWLENNGPDGKVWEKGTPNGHKVEVSPLKRVLLRAAPELRGELDHVVNAFDPWARNRGNYYSLQWKPRQGAETDVSFQTKP
jgi:hypothetical protein